MKLSVVTSLLVLLTSLVMACAAQSPALTPVEQEQIENVIKEYFVRNTTIPDYEVTVEEIASNWARVSISPAGPGSAATTLYLQKQVGVEEAPTATIAKLPGNEGRAGTSTGWTVILGPQAEFSEARLNEAGVPEEVRP